MAARRGAEGKASQLPVTARRRGQVLLLHLISLSILLVVTGHVVGSGSVLVERQQDRLAIDLAALAAARTEAEILTATAVINDVMVKEAQAAIVAVIAPVIAAVSVVGLPLVPGLVKTAAQVVPRAIRSMKRLERARDWLIRSAPVIVQYHTLRIARENGLKGAVALDSGKIPVTPDKKRSIETVLDFSRYFGGKGSLSVDPSRVRSLLELDEDHSRIKEDPARRALDRNRALKQKIRGALPTLVYLDERWRDRTITVVGLTAKNRPLAASARAIHPSFSHTDDGYRKHSDNLLIGPRTDLGPGKEFTAKLMAVPEFPVDRFRLRSLRDRIASLVRRLPDRVPLKESHLRWVHH